MEFVVAAVILAVLVLGILSYPWWRRRIGKAPPPLTGEHLAAELRDDVATGLLAADDLEPAAHDLEVTADTGGATEPARQRWGWGTAGLLLVPLAAVILYFHFGDWRAALLGKQAAATHQMEISLVALRAHLKAHPDDTQGWINLGQGDEALGRYQDAARAFGRAVALQTPPDPDVLGLWGEAQILANPHQVTPEEQQIFTRVLKLDPDNARGLWYGGLIALSAGNRAEVQKDWRRLLAQPDIPPQVADVVRSHLTMLRSSASAPVLVSTPASAASAASAGAASAAGPAFRVTVSLQPDLAGHGHFEPGATLFVFVRSLQGGPPLAVRRLDTAKFPVTVALDDTDAMIAGRDLSSVSGPVDVVARLSQSGNAAAQPGDLEGVRTVIVKPGTQSLDLTLDQVVGSAGSDKSGTPAPGS